MEWWSYARLCWFHSRQFVACRAVGVAEADPFAVSLCLNLCAFASLRDIFSSFLFCAFCAFCGQFFLCASVVKFVCLPSAVADFADDSEDGVVGLIFQGADKVTEQFWAFTNDAL